MPNDLLVFTCAYSGADATLLKRSCGLRDIDLQVYGEGKNWPGHTSGKIIEAAYYIESRVEPFAMFVDASDVIVLDSAAVILDQYQRIGSQILLSGEKNCWPDTNLSTHYPYPKPPFQNSPWRFINSGGWIGERRALIEALWRASEYEGYFAEDDQRCWAEWYLRWGRQIATIDSGCQIFQTMGGTHGHKLGPTGENLVTHQNPKVLHFNGQTPNVGVWYRALTGDLGWKGN